MIYNRFGAPVNILDVEERDLPSPRDGEMIPVWFVKVQLAGHYPDGSGQPGAPCHDGDWVQAGQVLVADGGWDEIMRRIDLIAEHKRNAGFAA